MTTLGNLVACLSKMPKNLDNMTRETGFKLLLIVYYDHYVSFSM